MNYVIIGNSAAAVGCIEGIRQVDNAGSITVVSRETGHTYSRPLISYLLSGKTDEQHMKYRPDSFYRDNGCMLLAGKTATRISPGKKQVMLDDGTALSYDKLLVATGSSPFVPPIQGLEDVVSKFTFMTMQDAKAKEAVSTGQEVGIRAPLTVLCVEGLAGRAYLR